MKDRSDAWAWLILAVLSLAGCGGGGNDTDSGTESRDPSRPAPRQGEVVVEPSTQTLTIDGEAHASVQVIRGLLADGAPALPAGYAIDVDDAFGQAGRVRFWVEPTDETGAEAGESETTAVFDALAAAFAERAEASLRGELAALRAQAEQAGDEVRKWQAENVAFNQRRRGLPETDASRLEKRRLDRAYDEALRHQIDLDHAVADLQRRVDRGRFATLIRIK